MKSLKHKWNFSLNQPLLKNNKDMNVINLKESVANKSNDNLTLDFGAVPERRSRGDYMDNALYGKIARKFQYIKVIVAIITLLLISFILLFIDKI